MLTFEGVAWGVDGHAIVADVDLSVGRGELVALLGPSGAGKTTLLRLAAGLIAPDRGRVSNDGGRTAMIFQEPRLLPWESALDNAALPLSAEGLPRAAARERARRWLSRLGLGEVDLAKRPAQLSGGMQARVAIARAFAVEPDLVLLDEPFAALDPARRQALQGILRDLVVGTKVAALFVTHDPSEAVRLADRIVVLSGTPGRIAATLANRPADQPAEIWGRVAELARRPELASLWRHPVAACD
jgi:NitT/TauT family transport system ATP-binding protein